MKATLLLLPLLLVACDSGEPPDLGPTGPDLSGTYVDRPGTDFPSEATFAVSDVTDAGATITMDLEFPVAIGIFPNPLTGAYFASTRDMVLTGTYAESIGGPVAGSATFEGSVELGGARVVGVWTGEREGEPDHERSLTLERQ